MRKILFFIFTGTIIFSFLLLFVYSRYNDGRLHIVVCDVGQGDSIYIKTPAGRDILIDGGPDRKVLSCLGEHMAFWDRSIDMVIMTHPDADHSLGLIDVLKRYKVSAFYTESVPVNTDIYKTLASVLANKKLSAKYLHAGDRLNESSGLSLQVLWPKQNVVDSVNQNVSKIPLNELSVVIKLDYADFEALFTGDAGFLVMEDIGNEVGDIDLLKVRIMALRPE